MNFETLTIDCPRPDIYGGIPAIQLQDDMPTVADYTPPYATAPAAEPTDKTYGELWMAFQSREERTSFYLAM